MHYQLELFVVDGDFEWRPRVRGQRIVLAFRAIKVAQVVILFAVCSVLRVELL